MSNMIGATKCRKGLLTHSRDSCFVRCNGEKFIQRVNGSVDWFFQPRYFTADVLLVLQC